MMQRSARFGTAKASRGFTVIELLVVAGVIILLASILIVAVNAATRASQKASTVSLMNAIKQGLERFRTDVGYLPPVLDDRRDLLPPPDTGDADQCVTDLQDWFSVTTLADYVVGYGHHGQDGYGYDADDASTWTQETPPVGIRNPGADGVWGAAITAGDNGGYGELSGRMASATNPNLDAGRVFGPYIELQDERLLGRLNPSTGEVSFPGEAGFNADPAPGDPKRVLVICDYWGKPIRFYRRPYPSTTDIGSPIQSSLTVTSRDINLSNVILLRPFEAKQERIVLDAVDYAGNTIDLSTYELQSAEYALVSSGPDQELNPEVRVDDPDDPQNTLGTDLVNEDNIVELGP